MAVVIDDNVKLPPVDRDKTIPGTTFPLIDENATARSPSAIEEEPIIKAGPTINGHATTITRLSPSQLEKSPLLHPLYEMVNETFRETHTTWRVLPEDLPRLNSTDQLLLQLRGEAGTFTYIITYSDTTTVLGTATMYKFSDRHTIVVEPEPHVSSDKYSSESDPSTGRHTPFDRVQSVPAGSEAWELKLMAVALSAQKQGMAGLLLRLCEEEVRARFVAGRDAARSGATGGLLFWLSAIKAINENFYSKRGFVTDYEACHPPGTLGSETGFTTIHMSKWISPDDRGESHVT